MRSNVDQLHFIRHFQYGIRHRLPDPYARQLGYRIVQALQMLHIHCRNDGNSILQQVDYIFISLPVSAARDIGMRKLIDKHNLRMPRNDSLGVHFLQYGGCISDLGPWDNRQSPNLLPCLLPPVCFQEANHHIDAFVQKQVPFLQHLIGFAHSGGRADIHLERAVADLLNLLLHLLAGQTVKGLFRAFGPGLDRENALPFPLRTVCHQEHIDVPRLAQHAVGDGALPFFLPAAFIGVAHHDSCHLIADRVAH
ncbi:hypothetical protein D3C81_812460 [compost metagenome]